jgi:hypothetical protein
LNNNGVEWRKRLEAARAPLTFSNPEGTRFLDDLIVARRETTRHQFGLRRELRPAILVGAIERAPANVGQDPVLEGGHRL